MKKSITICMLLCATLSMSLWGQKPFDFMPEGSFTKGIEGPATDKQGYIYAANFEREGTIGRIDPETQEGEIFIDLRKAVSDSSTVNGMRFGHDGLLYAADYVGHNLLAINIETKEVKIVAHNKSMSQPNDLAIAPNGTIYLSDPNWKTGHGKIWIYKNGKLEMMLDNLSCTNGIEVSPVGERLYVGLSGERKILVYDLMPDGKVGSVSEFAQFDDAGLDGMRCDVRGNLYVTRYDAGQVIVLNDKGKTIQTIELKGRKPSNLTFSDDMVFVTMADRGCFEVFKAQYVGRE